jgi:hypothetical protein
MLRFVAVLARCGWKQFGRRSPDLAEAAGVSGMILDVAVARLDAQLGQADAYDAKAIGILTVAALVVAVVAAKVDVWGPVWWMPVLGSLVTATFCCLVLVVRTFFRGSNLRTFYQDHAADLPALANAQMLSDLLDSIERNEDPLKRKLLWLKYSIWSVLVMLVSSAVSFALWR